MFIRLLISITLLQGKRFFFKKKIVFEKVVFGLWVHKLLVESWLLVPLEPSVNDIEW